jgi:hypothetical protein
MGDDGGGDRSGVLPTPLKMKLNNKVTNWATFRQLGDCFLSAVFL